jgi:hypothetical protein
MSDASRVDLTPRAVDAIARRVVELLREEAGIELLRQEAHARFEAETSPATLLTAADVARRFGLKRSWVYEHATALGAVRLGEGARPRLHFEARTVDSVLSARSTGERSPEVEAGEIERKRPGRPRRRMGTNVDLLPIRGPEAVRSTLNSQVAPRRTNARGRGDGELGSAASRTVAASGDVRRPDQPDLRQNEGGSDG